MVQLRIKVKPNSFKDEILFDSGGDLVIKIREKPIDGAANDHLIKFLSKELKLPKSSIVLEKGQASRFKRISFLITQAELDSRLSPYKK
jgi:uncharacterized protein (TIGR00251 family)